jgi:hypothetical protein
MDEEKKEVVKAEPVKESEAHSGSSSGSPKRVLSYWASIVSLIFAALYLLRVILTFISGAKALSENASGATPATPTKEISGEFLLGFLGIAGFVLLLIYGLRALKKCQKSSSPFAEFSLLYFAIGLVTCLNAIITLVCFGTAWRSFYDVFASAALAVIGIILYERKDGTILKNQILFYVASGIASTLSALNFENSLNSDWHSFYDFSHGFIPLVFYVLAVLSVVFEERRRLAQ